jgi:hypothetical protein
MGVPDRHKAAHHPTGHLKYTGALLFRDLGATSSISKDNGLAKGILQAPGRQSDRSVPKCSLFQRYPTGRLMGREYRGKKVLLMLCILRSSAEGAVPRSVKEEVVMIIRWTTGFFWWRKSLPVGSLLCQEGCKFSDVKNGDEARFLMQLIRGLLTEVWEWV